MGIFKKRTHKIIEEVSSPNFDTDDFDMNNSIPEPTREDFHKKAEEVLQETVAAGNIEIVNPSEEDTSSDNSEEVAETVESAENSADTFETDDATEIDKSETDEPGEIAEAGKSETNDDTSDVAPSDAEIIITDEEFAQTDSANQQTVPTNDDPTPVADDFDEDDDFDDFDDFSIDNDDQQTFIDEQQQTLPFEKGTKQKKEKKEKKPRMTFAEFCKKHRKGLKNAVAVLCVFFAIFIGLYIYGCSTIPTGVMGRNIYIEDVNVSGLTYDEALAKVKETSLLDDYDITVVCNKKLYTINGLDIGLTARVEDTVAKAMDYGKSGNVLVDGFVNTLQLGFKHTIVPSANVDEKTLRTKLAEFGNLVHGELVQHKLEIGDGKVICTPGHSGFSGNTDAAYKQVIAALENEKFKKIKVPLDSAAPKKLTAKDIDIFTYTNPQDARFEIDNNTVTVIPEVWGRYLNMEEVEKYVSEIKEDGDVVNIPFYSSAPAVNAEQLNSKLFNAQLGSYSTYYGSSTANRAANVANAASKINNKILAPGEVFSFNETVGKRSVANGFYQAPEYANGQTVMGIGGGTCQVSSTLYNAVLYSDLSVVSRLNHMFAVGYCPAGQDATVSDSGVDFKFANNTDYPIKISSVTTGGKIIVTIYGTQRDVQQTVKIENYTSYSGGNRTIRTYRLVYDSNGTLLRKEEMPKSYYMSH